MRSLLGIPAVASLRKRPVGSATYKSLFLRWGMPQRGWAPRNRGKAGNTGKTWRLPLMMCPLWQAKVLYNMVRQAEGHVGGKFKFSEFLRDRTHPEPTPGTPRRKGRFQWVRQWTWKPRESRESISRSCYLEVLDVITCWQVSVPPGSIAV